MTRVATVVRFPVGLAVGALRYLESIPFVVRHHDDGDADDLPPALPTDLLDDRSKPLTAGNGPLFHRTFAVEMRDADVDAAGLFDRVVTDLDRAAPCGAVSFWKTRGRVGELVRGDEYRVRMPAPWDGPVRVVDRDACSFRFATLARHLEAGQIEFRAIDLGPGRLRFEIEAWSVAGDLLARLFYVELLVGREIQLGLWVQYLLGTVHLAGARRDGPVSVLTRRLEQPSHHLPDAAPR